LIRFPTNTQTLLCFSSNRLIQSINPLGNIALIKSSISEVETMVSLKNFSLDHFLHSAQIKTAPMHISDTMYVDYLAEPQGFDAVKVVEAIAISRLSPNNHNIQTLYDTYTDVLLNYNLTLPDSSILLRSFYPFNYTNSYSKLTMSDISKKICVASVDDTAPTSQYFFSSLYIHETTNMYINSALTHNIFPNSATVASSSLRSYFNANIANRTFNTMYVNIRRDLSEYFGSNIGLYNTMQALFLGSISGSDQLSTTSKFEIFTEISKSLSTALYPVLDTYFKVNISTFVDNIIIRYIDLLVDYHSSTLTQTILTTDAITSIAPVLESSHVQFIEDDFNSNRNDQFELLLDLAPTIAETAKDYPNILEYLLQALMTDIDVDISKFTDQFELPKNLLFGGVNNAQSVANYLHTYASTINLNSSNAVNKTLLDAAIAFEFTSVLDSQLNVIYTDNPSLNKLFANVDSLFTSIIDTNRTQADRLNTYMSMIQLTINSDIITSVDSILPSFTSALYSDLSFTQPMPIQYFDTNTWLNLYYTDHRTSDTISRAAVCAYYAYLMYTYLDNYSLNPTVV